MQLVRDCLLSGLMAVLVAAALAPRAIAADPVSDDTIYDKVRLKLAGDRELNGGGIEVNVSNGVVELRGTVMKEKQKIKAEKLAKKVKGVQKVINNLKVAPP